MEDGCRWARTCEDFRLNRSRAVAMMLEWCQKMIPPKFVVLFLCASLQTVALSAEPAVVDRDDLQVRVQKLLSKAKQSLRLLKGGTFDMGDWGTDSGRPYDSDAWSRPLHKVTLDSFSIMAYKVTYEDFDVFTDATGNERIDMDEIGVQHRAPRRPAGVSWHGAKAYCRWLAAMTRLPFDLPTEAQWEYAARSGGKRTLFATDNGKIERGRNFPEEWKFGEKKRVLPDVGSFPPNAAGLYGMSEDTSEWVNDWFDEKYYTASPVMNPLGPARGTKKVMRGSVGGSAEIAAMVFMRAASVPQPLHETYPNGLEWDNRVEVNFPGYSGYSDVNFRCAVGADYHRD
jgi:formylglycine-generating enzyme